MTPIKWSAQAITDLKSLQRFIAKDDPTAARQVAEHILNMITTVLRPNPEIGRAGRAPGTREYVVRQARPQRARSDDFAFRAGENRSGREERAALTDRVGGFWLRSSTVSHPFLPVGGVSSVLFHPECGACPRAAPAVQRGCTHTS